MVSAQRCSVDAVNVLQKYIQAAKEKNTSTQKYKRYVNDKAAGLSRTKNSLSQVLASHLALRSRKSFTQCVRLKLTEPITAWHFIWGGCGSPLWLSVSHE